MIELIIFMMSVIGMAHILVDGSIFNSFKTWLGEEGWAAWPKGKLLELMNCYQCSGFWSGVVIGLGMWVLRCDPLHVGWSWHILLALFAYGCAGAFISTMAAVVTVWFQTNSGAQE